MDNPFNSLHPRGRVLTFSQGGGDMGMDKICGKKEIEEREREREGDREGENETS